MEANLQIKFTTCIFFAAVVSLMISPSLQSTTSVKYCGWFDFLALTILFLVMNDGPSVFFFIFVFKVVRFLDFSSRVVETCLIFIRVVLDIVLQDPFC